MPDRIYLDHAATTPVDRRVLAAMIPYYQNAWGNPSGIYMEAQRARRGLDEAREQVADLLECLPTEIIFTSGGTESDNLAIRGALAPRSELGRHVISTPIEHHAVLHTLEALDREGYDVTLIPVDSEGFVDPAAVQAALREDTALVTIMAANNEVGTLQPIAAIARAVKERNPRTLVHTDAVQAVGVLDIRPDALGVDLISLTAHKIYGPKGIGLLYVRQRTELEPQILGGSQERERRAGTENVAGAVAFAAALELAIREREQHSDHVRRLRDKLWLDLRERIDGLHLNGPADFDRRLPNNLSLCFSGVEGESILLQLDMAGIAASSGSACSTGSTEPSHVLTAMGVDSDLAHAAVRLSFGAENDNSHVDRVAAELPQVIDRLRSLSPVA